MEGLASVGLTAGLVYLYFRQTSILESQKQLTKTEYSPEIDVDTIKPTDRSKRENNLEVGIINGGEGTAFTPGICAEVNGDNLENYEGMCMNMKPSESTDLFSGLSTNVPPNGEEKSFYASIRLKDKEKEKTVGLSKFLREVHLEGISDIKMTISIGVYNQLGERDETQILDLLINLDELFDTGDVELEDKKSEDLPEVDIADVLFNGLSNRWDTVIPNEGEEYYVTEKTTSDKTDLMVERAIRSHVDDLEAEK